MTSELTPRRDVEPLPLSAAHATCLCCAHFAVDLEAMPEAHDKRRARMPKRKPLASVGSS